MRDTGDSASTTSGSSESIDVADDASAQASGFDRMVRSWDPRNLGASELAADCSHQLETEVTGDGLLYGKSTLDDVDGPALQPEACSSTAPDPESIGEYENASDGKLRSEEMDSVKDRGTAALQRVRTSYFSPRLAQQRRKVAQRVVLTIVVLGVLCFTMFCLFYGAIYRTSHYVNKIHVLCVIQDDIVTNSSITPLTSLISSSISRIPGNWEIYNESDFQRIHPNQTISEAVFHQIHEQFYWIALNVHSNVTDTLVNSLTNSSSREFNSSEFFDVSYETGRDPTSVSAYVVPLARNLEAVMKEAYIQDYLPSLMSNISVQIPSTMDGNRRLTAVSNFNFNYIDYRPFYDRILLAPTQISLVYCVLLTVFAFFLMGPVHSEMATVLHRKYLLFYRVGVTWFVAFFTSLFYCTVSAIYQIDFTKSFGRAGFIIYWMTTWLFMVAIGGAHENVVYLIFSTKPQFVGIWILSFTIINIATAFYPFDLNNRLYRYGYMMPVHNAVDIFRSLFFDLTRRHMGRNYGILVAWIAVNTILLPFFLKLAAYLKKK